jgi:hypothetical protein
VRGARLEKAEEAPIWPNLIWHNLARKWFVIGRFSRRRRPGTLQLVGDTVGGVVGPAVRLGNGGVWRRINNGTEG